MKTKLEVTTRMRRSRIRCGCVLVACMATAVAGDLRAEDAGFARPYLHLRRGEFNHKWGVQDMWGVGFGWNLNRYLGAELAVDTLETSLHDPGLGHTIGEESLVHAAVQARLRYPLLRDRLVPYAVAGAGVAVHQFNDRKSAGFGHLIDGDATGWGLSLGGGVEYFIADNIAVGLEAKYSWFDPVVLRVDGREIEHDASDMTVTVGLRLYLQEVTRRSRLGEGDETPTRLYLGGRVGGSILTDADWTPSLTVESEAAAWGGWFNPHYGMILGADFGKHWGIELSADGGEYTVVDSGAGALAEMAVVALVPQVRWRWPLAGGKWVPFAAAGVGVAMTEVNDLKPASEGRQFSADGLGPAVAAGVGAEWFIARNLSFSLETRWMSTWGHEAEFEGRSDRGGFSHVQVLLGFRMYLVELGR